MVEEKIKKPGQETWRKPINSKRCLILYKATAIIIGLSTLLALIYVIYNKDLQPIYTQVKRSISLGTRIKPEYVCNSAECIHTASRVLKYMDKNKDPCENFYDFACGGFVENTYIPDREVIDSFLILKNLNVEQITNIIEKPIQNDEPHPFQLVKKLYSACMDVKRIEKEGLKTLINILENIGEWPLLHGNSWVEDDFNWKECDYSLKKHGYPSYFFKLEVHENYENLTNRISLRVPVLLNDQYYYKYLYDIPRTNPFEIVSTENMSPNHPYYFKYMVDIAELFGVDRRSAEYVFKESADFEYELSSGPDDISGSTIQMTIAQLESKFPSIPWMEYINNLLAPDNQVTKDEIIIVVCPNDIAHFEAVISRTPKRILANYVMWRVVVDSIEFLTDALRKKKSDYILYFGGEFEELPRREECLNICKERLDIAFAAMYVRRYFSAKAKQTAVQMVSDIRSEFYEILKNVDWMDEKTRKYALEKAEVMKSDIGCPDQILDMAMIEEYYKSLELDTVDYLPSILKIEAFRTRLSYQKLRQRSEKNDWNLNIFVYNYNPEYSMENRIEVPAGSLQGIFFDVDRPAYMNYASIGFVIGQSITYGFTDMGRSSGKNGEYVHGGWWQDKTRIAFDKKERCFIDQYRERYSVRKQDNKMLDLYTPTTILGDHGGIKMAYLAYNKWLESNELEPKLPGLNYTSQQMFWISAANTLCSKYRPNPRTDDQLKGNSRVLGAFSNSEYFINDFNCPAGTPMNPSKKCKFW